MATKLWEQEIDKTVDWGGDNSTGGAPVSGQYVQKFLKEPLSFLHTLLCIFFLKLIYLFYLKILYHS